MKCESLIGNLTLFAVVVLLGSGTLERVTPDTRLSGYVSTSRQSSILPQSHACSSSHFFIQDLSYTRYFVLRHTKLLDDKVLISKNIFKVIISDIIAQMHKSEESNFTFCP